MKRFVKKGNHYSIHPIGIHFGIRKFKFRFKLDGSCLYPILDADDYDLNKLYGFSYGYHHKNSIRIGWRPDERDDKKIQLHSYVYNKGKRTMNYIDSIITDKWYEMEIETLLCNKVVFTLSDNKVLSKRTEDFVMPKFIAGYFLDFYIGGNKPARKDTIAYIERIKN